VDSSKSSLASKEKIELNISQPLNTEINLNKTLDIGDFLNSNLHINNIFKKQLLEDHWKTLNKNDFPFSTHKKCGSIEKRLVKIEHLEKYFWLVISKSMNGLFCVYCSVFNHSNTGTGSKNTMPLKCLVTEPLTKFAQLLGKDGYLETHRRNFYHKNAVQDGKSFLHIYNNY